MCAKLSPLPDTWSMTMQPTQAISKREHFALEILKGMLASGNPDDRIMGAYDLRGEEFYEGFHPSMVNLTVRAFKMADCMLGYPAYEDEYIAVFDNPNEPKSESNHDDIKSV